VFRSAWTETAAKFSTAAAAALAQSRIKNKEEEAPAAKPAASPERAAAAEDSHEAAGHAAGDGGSAAAVASAAAAAAALGSTGTPTGAAVPLQRRSSSGLPHTASGGVETGAAAVTTVPELPRRSSIQGMGSSFEGAAFPTAIGDGGGVGLPAAPVATTLPAAPGGAAAATLSPAKRAVLRAALPAAPTAADETPPREDQVRPDAPGEGRGRGVRWWGFIVGYGWAVNPMQRNRITRKASQSGIDDTGFLRRGRLNDARLSGCASLKGHR
jgi:hypothetical protein